MKKAFTMIELIFTIVIIGILAAVAIPKLNATRDDARISSIISDIRVLLGDLGGYYSAQGSSRWDNNASIKEASNVEVSGSECSTLDENTSHISPATFTLCNDGTVCVTFTTTNGGYLTIADGTDTTNIICEEVKADPAIRALSNTSYKLGGETVVR